MGDTLVFYRDTPLNWAALYPDALRSVAAVCGFSPTTEQLAAAGQSLARYNTRIVPRTSEVRAEEILSSILRVWGIDASAQVQPAIRAFFTFFRQRLSVYAETIPVLTSLRERGILIGILTDVAYGMPREFVQQDLNDAGISGLSDVLLTSVDAGMRKPEAAGYIALAARLGVALQEMLYVGNEPKDVIGASRAGVLAVFLDREGRGDNYGQQFTISTLNGIAEIIHSV